MMTGIEIRIELMKKGITEAMIGRELGVSRQSVSMTISRRINSKRIRIKIAEIIKKKFNRVWGENGLTR